MRTSILSWVVILFAFSVSAQSKFEVKDFGAYLDKLNKPVEKVIANYHAAGFSAHAPSKFVMIEGMPQFVQGDIYKGGYAQKKTVLLDVSHEIDTAYTHVNLNMFEQYKDLVCNKIGANLIINKDKELSDATLTNVDAVIILSPLDRERKTPKNNLTHTERGDLVSYVRNGGKLIFFMDEEHRVDMRAFGANDVLKPFGMELGLDLPPKANAGATSLVSNLVKNVYELSYSGSRSLAGGMPISRMNGEEGHVHGAYVKLDNGGMVVAFGETMTGLFMGGVEMTLTNGMTITWKGKDDSRFMRELIEAMLKDE